MGKHEQEHKAVHDVIQSLEDLLNVDEHMFPGDGSNSDDYYHDSSVNIWISGSTFGQFLREPEPKFVTALGLEFENLAYTVVKKHKLNGKWESQGVDLIQGISGVANKGKLTAILGPSGAGKSTLLDALAGRIAEGSLGGTVWYEGQQMTGSYIKQNSAYVMQQDLLFPLLTVTETLLFSAEMRLSSSMPRGEKLDRVQALLIQLGLEHCAHTKIGDEKHQGISGGEKRRVSIGVDIIHGPSLLFLDEPTSGLDSTSALIVVEKLVEIASAGSTVLITIHQPSYRIQQMFSRVLILARGQVVYQGAPDDLGEYLEAFGREVPRNTNNVEYLLDLIKEFEQSDAGLDPLVQFQREGSKTSSKQTSSELHSSPQLATVLSKTAKSSDGSKTSSKQTSSELHSSPQLATVLSKTPKSSSAEDDDDGDFDHSLTNMRSPLTPGLKLAQIFYRPSWSMTPKRSPQATNAYFTAGATTPPSSTEPGFHRDVKNQLEAVGERTSTSTSCSSVTGMSDDDDWEEAGRTYQNRWDREVLLLMGRDLKNVIRTPKLFVTKLVKAFLLSAILATLMRNPKENLDGVYIRLSFFAFMNILVVFSSNDSLPAFIQERYVLLRETGSNAYRPSSYVVSSLLVYFPTTCLHALVYVVITWWALHLHGGASGFFILVLIFFISIVTANSFALLISALVPDYVTGYTTVLSLTLVTFVFCGYLVRRSQIPAYWVLLHYMSPMKYSLQAALRNEFVKGECFSRVPVPHAPGNLQELASNSTVRNHPGCYMVGSDVVDAYDLTDFSIAGCIGMLVLWCVAYRVLLYIVFRYYTKSERK